MLIQSELVYSSNSENTYLFYRYLNSQKHEYFLFIIEPKFFIDFPGKHY